LGLLCANPSQLGVDSFDLKLNGQAVTVGDVLGVGTSSVVYEGMHQGKKTW